MKPELSPQIFEKHSHIKFHENRSSGNLDVPCGRAETHTRTHITKLAVAFRNFGNAPKNRGPGSVFGMATGYGPGIETRWGRDFLHLSGPGTHPASCTMGTGSFPGVKSGRGVTLPLPKNQSVTVVYGNNHCLFRDPHKTHKYTVGA